MVEGPGATRNARKLQCLLGWNVRSIQEHSASESSAALAECAERNNDNQNGLEGCHVQAAFSVGKQVFVTFSDACKLALCFHFGMNGSLWIEYDNNKDINDSSSSNRYRMRTGQSTNSVCFKMAFVNPLTGTTADLICRGSTVKKISSVVANSRRERLFKRDVCASDADFDVSDVVSAILTRPTALIADALLDQDRFPGVGNIIKIEGLHAARIHPKRLVSSLSHDELTLVIGHCRTYARKWLQTGRAPWKKVYNQTMCQTCRGIVAMVKIGNDLSRVTFWCQTCQTIATTTSVASISSKRPIVEEPLQTLSQPLNDKKVRLNDDRPRTGSCPQHGAQTVQLRRVRKAGETQNRLFYICRRKDCQYFAWADTHFPTCCKTKTLLRVSKTERTGGKWFLSCSKCSFFAWATPQQLAPLEHMLTPLL